MSHPTLTPLEYKAIQDANKKVPQKVTEKINYITKEVSKRSTGFVEGLAFVLMVFFYFFFTGLAILFKRKLPKFWEEMGSSLEGGRITQKVQDVVKQTDIKKKAGKMRIVDLETGQSI